MFSAKVIATFFIASFMLVLIRYFFENRSSNILKFILSIELITYFYLLIAGVYLLVGWVDPTVGAEVSETSRAASAGRGRGGFIILIIKYWPYFLIGLSIYYFYYFVKNGWLRELLKK